MRMGFERIYWLAPECCTLATVVFSLALGDPDLQWSHNNTVTESCFANLTW